MYGLDMYGGLRQEKLNMQMLMRLDLVYSKSICRQTVRILQLY
jgi:hypothetical protein